jgi:hypothetical protein
VDGKMDGQKLECTQGGTGNNLYVVGKHWHQIPRRGKLKNQRLKDERLRKMARSHNGEKIVLQDKDARMKVLVVAMIRQKLNG